MDRSLEKLIRFEFYCLCALAFLLPIVETAKHIVCIIYLILFTMRAMLHKNSIKKSPFDKYIILYITGSIITSLGALYKGYEVEKLHDIIRYSLIGLMALHTPLSRKQTYTILLILIFSTFIGIADAYYSLHYGIKKYFELRSVGHINHSSIYILLIIGTALPMLLRVKSYQFIGVLLISCLLIYCLFYTNSRATAVALGFIIATFIIITLVQHKKMAYFICTITAIFITYSIWNPPKIISKFIGQNTYYKNKLTPREKIWNAAFYAWKKEPLYGVGYGNYKVVTPKKMQQWYKNNTTDFSDSSRFLYISHSHNRYINTLVEGGIIGFLSLVVLLLGVLSFLLKSRKIVFEVNKNIIFWTLGLNTFLVITIVGLFNTTLHHEHGLLAMMLLGLSFQHINRQRNNNET